MARMTPAQRRHRAEARRGLAMLAGVALAFAGLIYGAATVDASQGKTVSQSLADWGL